MGKRTKATAKESAHGNRPHCYQVHLFLLIAEMFITICLSLLGPKDYQSGDRGSFSSTGELRAFLKFNKRVLGDSRYRCCLPQTALVLSLARL